MNSDVETGISIMKIVEDLDSGPVMKKIKVEINQSTTTEELSKNLSKISSESIIEILDKIFCKQSKFVEQDHKIATYAKKINKNESKINWSNSAQKILAKINGLNPNPGAWFIYKEKRYKIWKAKIIDKTGPAGTILNNKFILCCGDQSLEIIEIQKEGKNKLPLRDFLFGINFKQGDILK